MTHSFFDLPTVKARCNIKSYIGLYGFCLIYA
nr:MAG TPA: hypothetical protein [Caudoviricetes sp.]